MMQKKLPYDVVFILNEFFGATGKAITQHGGTIDKFLGDGLLAVFGQRNGPEEGSARRCRPPAPSTSRSTTSTRDCRAS